MSAFPLVAAEAASDTWGVSGPQFLTEYVVLGLVVAGLVTLATRGTRRPGNRAIPADRLTPVQLGLLAGGDQLAVTVALAELRRHELVDITGCPITPVDPAGRPLLRKPQAGLDAVGRAVLDSVGVSRIARLSPSALARRPQVSDALALERRLLTEAGLLTTRPHRAGYVAAGLLGAAFVALGIGRIAAGSVNHKPIGFLVVLVVVAAVAVPVHLARAGTSRLSSLGKATMRQLRTTHLHLTPSLHPAWATYGPGSVVLATALFGGAVMYEADPLFAQAVNMRATATGGFGSTNAGGGNSSSGGSGCGGGSSCGGGGCGGGCGG